MALSWPLSSAAINFATAGDQTLVTGVAGQIVTVYKLFLVSSLAATLTFKDGTGGTALTGPMSIAANGSLTFPFDTTAWFFASPGNNFVLTQTTTTSQISGRIYYSQR